MPPKIPDVNNRSVNKPHDQLTKKKAVKIHNALTGEDRKYCTEVVAKTIEKAAKKIGWHKIEDIGDRFALTAKVIVQRNVELVETAAPAREDRSNVVPLRVKRTRHA